MVLVPPKMLGTVSLSHCCRRTAALMLVKNHHRNSVPGGRWFKHANTVRTIRNDSILLSATASASAPVPMMDPRTRRHFSSSSFDNNVGSRTTTTAATPGTTAKQQSGTAVRLQETARAAKKRRPPVAPGSSTNNNTGDAGRPVPLLRKQQQHKSNKGEQPPDSSSSSETTTTTPSSSQPQPQQHPAHFYLDGGLPCDPVCPPYRLAEYGEESLYTLILLRHGESEWNVQNRYTGWCDVNLTERGRQEARTAGRLLFENRIEVDQAFTSVLKRAGFSCNMALNAAQQHWVPVTKTWRLNERHYGALQGYNKDSAWKELHLDQELVMQMRRAYDVRPPTMMDNHEYWHGNDRRYRKLTREQLDASRAESLKDAADRIMPFFDSVITPSIKSGKKCLIVSHANTIRTLVKHIDRISDEDIKGMTIPTGIPLLYRLDKNMRPVDPQVELEFRYMVEPKGYSWGTSRAHGFHGVYLGDQERLQGIQQKRDATNRDWQKVVLRNIGKSLGWEMAEKEVKNVEDALRQKRSVRRERTGPDAVETRQLWWQVHEKMKLPEYANMLLLVRMQSCLEDLMYVRKQKYITQNTYEELVQKIHLDTEGCVVEPFVDLADRQNREERQQIWYENLALDLEEECLIK